MLDFDRIKSKVFSFLEIKQIASTCEIGIFLTGQDVPAINEIPSRKQLEAVLEIMSNEKSVRRVRKIKDIDMPDGFDVSEEVRRSFLWAHPSFPDAAACKGGLEK